MTHMKCQDCFSNKNISQPLSAAVMVGTLRVNFVLNESLYNVVYKITV